MNDREWDIFMMEIEVRNEAIIEDFLISQMRPRDIEAIEQQEQEQQLQLQPPVEP